METKLKHNSPMETTGPTQVGLQMVWIMNGIWNPEAQPFEIQTDGLHFVINHLKSGQKHPDPEEMWNLEARTFECQTKVPPFLYFSFENTQGNWLPALRLPEPSSYQTFSSP